MKGQVTRAAGPAFEQMLAGAGASIASMPSSEIYTAMQTGVLDAANTSSGSFVSYRIYEQVKCLTAPGDYALWFMYEPILMSKKSLGRSEQGPAGCSHGCRQSRRGVYDGPGQGVSMTSWSMPTRRPVSRSSPCPQRRPAAWRDIANETSYKIFSEKVPGGKELIEKALAVE